MPAEVTESLPTPMSTPVPAGLPHMIDLTPTTDRTAPLQEALR